MIRIINGWMKLDSNRLQAFFAVASKGSFHGAAQELSLTQSALSQRVAKLEDELEAHLFIRGPQGVVLTSLGEDLLAYCREINALETDFLDYLHPPKSGEFSGKIKVAGYSSVLRSLILPALAPFLRENPLVQLELFESEVRDLPRKLFSAEADFIITNTAVDSLMLKEIGQEENVHVRNKDGHKNRFIDHDRDDPTTVDFFKMQGKEAPREFIFLDEIYSILDAVSLGLGEAIVSRHLLQNYPQLTVVRYPNKMISSIYLGWIPRGYMPKLHERVILELSKLQT